MNIEIKNGRVIDPKNGIDRSNTSLYIADGKVAGIGEAPAGFVAEQSIDAASCVVCPGLIDLGARLNSIEAELAAAVAGGVTSVVVPPDADPPLDEPELADRLVHRGEEIGKARVLPLGALTLGLKGERLAELAGLKKAGCVAFSQDNKPVVDTEALLRAMEYAATFDFAVWLQPQDYWLSRNGIAHEGEVASRLGLAGIPVAAETIAIGTIIQLVRITGCRVHLTRISSAAGMALVHRAQHDDLPITCDVGVHHLLLTENDIGYFNPHARFCPPLRTQNDRQALSDAVVTGWAAICSDHTPVGADDKLLPFGEAKPGATGLEVLLPLTLKWAEAAKVDLPTALARITSAPAAVLGLASGQLAFGAMADICIFDPEANWQLTPEALKSRGKNSPWLGYMMTGQVKATLVGGRLVYQA
ncbi:dihydroorotase [Ferribacterium limneticum]|uniref:dihydroorotase n=1 Tax=Ferribacterium limneticum TaxID=76259 RepID=UPI001CFA6BEC|nr:dihydroorotase [Ferribacterium limneticum]UCV28211.1 dihydroorotase [Ferribacterium limneticum]UCV32128.1 dihydroorotase [Ferribacterium limneticum]